MDNETGEKSKIVALSQLEQISLKLLKAKKISNKIALEKIYLRSHITTITRSVTTSGIVLTQKTSYTLGNFYVSYC